MTCAVWPQVFAFPERDKFNKKNNTSMSRVCLYCLKIKQLIVFCCISFMNVNMDFSSLNPNSTNALNMAARKNKVDTVNRLLKKMNPNCTDNRGWTSLHEAAAADSYESLLLILKHRDCRPLAETHEGHTALYLACRYGSSIKTIQALLDSDEDIANYGSLENVTPLHLVSGLGRLDVMQLLIDYGAMLDVQDFDGDTALHDAALEKQHEAVSLLLHAGADANIKNMGEFTAFHLACTKGCLETVKNILPFVSDINETAKERHSALLLAVTGSNEHVITYLLENGADPNIINLYNQLPLHMSMLTGDTAIFKTLLSVTDKKIIDPNIIYLSSRPHNFNLDILEQLLVSDLGPEFFQTTPQFYDKNAQRGIVPLYLTVNPLGTYLDVCEYVYRSSPEKFRKFFYLFLMRGGSVNALDVNECPPLVYVHHRPHTDSFDEIFQIFIENDCNVDYMSGTYTKENDFFIPDAFIASLVLDPTTLTKMTPYSLRSEPELVLSYARKKLSHLATIPNNVQQDLLVMVDRTFHSISTERISCYVACLKHLCRRAIRTAFKKNQTIKSTNDFLAAINKLPLPHQIKDYLRYL